VALQLLGGLVFGAVDTSGQWAAFLFLFRFDILCSCSILRKGLGWVYAQTAFAIQGASHLANAGQIGLRTDVWASRFGRRRFALGCETRGKVTFVIDLGYILRRAWEITWRHKTLWLFGFLVSLGTVSTRLGTSSSRWESVTRELPPEMQRRISGFLGSPYLAVAIVALVLVGIALSVGLALLGALARAALVDQVRTAEDVGIVTLRSGWEAGRRHLWTVFGIRLLLGLPVIVATVSGVLPVVGTALLIAGQDRLAVLVSGVFAMEFALFACLVPAICLAVLLSVPLSVLQRLAVRACVFEERGARESISSAWSMSREHLGALALVWLLLLCVGVGVMMAVFLPLVLAMVALMTISLLAAFFSPLAFVGLVLVIGFSAWLLGAAVNSVVETFSSAVWTLTYRELTGLGLTGEETLLPAKPPSSPTC
jgi:hypothetical protein